MWKLYWKLWKMFWFEAFHASSERTCGVILNLSPTIKSFEYSGNLVKLFILNSVFLLFYN